MTAPVLVGILNSSDDTVEMLRYVLEEEGFVVVSAHVDDLKRQAGALEQFARQAPQVVIYDVAPPYDRNWRFLELVRAQPPLAETQWVVTSTNPARLHEMTDVGDQPILEIIGKPYDIRAIVDAVIEKVRLRA